ncbi:hypothetical protein LJR098_002564 [Rhizobium sp. LjRoot98]|uniref:hypothetical protein n=1 Tax=unclassified Rhizobium TaxID=2613769 RepID=UPI000714CFA3|nr:MULTISPECIES: hypothetical protein [unclassified Rhizobium]KQV31251.1 hypothetical protein ASC96_08690 [Rhizobium sp. Root1204]KQY10798.1 hypothetical protein ASD36_08770 [Rhizobium sp. Root1334]
MKLSTSVLTAIVLVLQPTLAMAGEQFATVEASTLSNNQIVTGSLYSSEIDKAQDGTYVVHGYMVGSGRTMEVEARIPEGGIEVPKQGLTVNGASLTQLHSYEFNTLQTRITKSFYKVDGAASGAITVTDDPLPIIGWLVIAGVTMILVPAVVCLEQENKKLLIKVGLNSDNRPEAGLECVPAT